MDALNFSKNAKRASRIRSFALFMIAVSLALTAAAGPKIKVQAPGFYRMTLGDFVVTVLSDGTTVRPVDTIMSKPEEVRRVLALDHETLPIEMSINAFLIDTGEKLVLVDTGAGELFGPDSGGRLVSNLRAAGYAPEQIDAVLLTHMHADHSGGLSIGGRRVFTNATVYVDKRDPAFWLNADPEKATPANKKRIQQSHATVDPYINAGKLKTFDGETELFPGIRSVPAYGHTPGHTAYMVESKGARLLLWGDVIHCAEVQFPEPSIGIQYDNESPAAIATRIKLMAQAAKEGFLVGSAHISFPGLGHIRADGQGYVWIPVPYSANP